MKLNICKCFLIMLSIVISMSFNMLNVNASTTCFYNSNYNSAGLLASGGNTMNYPFTITFSTSGSATAMANSSYIGFKFDMSDYSGETGKCVGGYFNVDVDKKVIWYSKEKSSNSTYEGSVNTEEETYETYPCYYNTGSDHSAASAYSHSLYITVSSPTSFTSSLGSSWVTAGYSLILDGFSEQLSKVEYGSCPTGYFNSNSTQKKIWYSQTFETIIEELIHTCYYTVDEVGGLPITSGATDVTVALYNTGAVYTISSYSAYSGYSINSAGFPNSDMENKSCPNVMFTADENSKQLYLKTTSNDETCSGLLGDYTDPNYTAYYVQTAFDIIKYLAIAALMVLTVIDYLRAITEQDADSLKVANKKTITRIIYTVILFIFPTILEFIFELTGIYTDPFCGLDV